MNGEDIRKFTLKSLRSRIGIVTQDTFLFNDTVANNIAYGNADASLEAIEEAARKANAHDFIRLMENGYNTVIGERGVRISGGQCQRLSIARALLRNPPILILDEATSALDTESERLVQAAINELVMGRTVFAVAHRLSTIIHCNKIVVLEHGRIAESGTHRNSLRRAVFTNACMIFSFRICKRCMREKKQRYDKSRREMRREGCGFRMKTWALLRKTIRI